MKIKYDFIIVIFQNQKHLATGLERKEEDLTICLKNIYSSVQKLLKLLNLARERW